MLKKIVKQDGFKDCGPCCLLMIIKHYKGYYDIEELKNMCKTDKSGTTAYQLRFCRFSDCASSGCRAVRSTRRSSVDSIGRTAPFSNAQRALARNISVVAIKCSERSTSAISMRSVSVKVVRMRTISLRSSYSNSRNILFNSTTSAGST